MHKKIKKEDKRKHFVKRRTRNHGGGVARIVEDRQAIRKPSISQAQEGYYKKLTGWDAVDAYTLYKLYDRLIF